MRDRKVRLIIGGLCAGAIVAATGFGATSAQTAQRTSAGLRPAPQSTFIAGSDPAALFTAENSGTTFLSSAGIYGIMNGGPYGFGIAGLGLNTARPNIGVLGFDEGPGGFAMYGDDPYPSASNASPAPGNQTTGVVGSAANGDGVMGETSVQTASTGSIAGVVGQDLANDSGENDGVLGTTTSGGWGVDGIEIGPNGNGAVRALANDGDGIDAYTQSGTGIYVENHVTGDALDAYAETGVGVYGSQNANTGNSYPSPGVWGESDAHSGAGVYGTSINGGNGLNGVVGIGDFIGVVAQTSGGHYAFATASSPAEGGFLKVTVDDAGNLSTPGTITGAAVARTGAIGKAYMARAMSQTLEDTGSSAIVDGSATVRLDPAFSQLMNDPNYQVFLTPNGDCRGLYVTAKTSTSFAVHELQGGRSSVPFDYRIVARANGHGADRVTLTAAAKLSVFRGAPPTALQVALMQHHQPRVRPGAKYANAGLMPKTFFIPAVEKSFSQVRQQR